MPVPNRIAALAPGMVAWRRRAHRRPELGFGCHATAAFVADRLCAMGVAEVHAGIAESGLVALIRGQGKGPVIGLRADMDALPIREATGAPHASGVAGAMDALPRASDRPAGDPSLPARAAGGGSQTLPLVPVPALWHR